MYRGADKSLARPGSRQANVSVRVAWISFGALPCRGKENLMTDRVSILLKSCVSPDMFPSLFHSFRAKDLSATQYSLQAVWTYLFICRWFKYKLLLVGLRTYQHPRKYPQQSNPRNSPHSHPPMNIQQSDWPETSPHTTQTSGRQSPQKTGYKLRHLHRHAKRYAALDGVP